MIQWLHWLNYFASPGLHLLKQTIWDTQRTCDRRFLKYIIHLKLFPRVVIAGPAPLACGASEANPGLLSAGKCHPTPQPETGPARNRISEQSEPELADGSGDKRVYSVGRPQLNSLCLVTLSVPGSSVRHSVSS